MFAQFSKILLLLFVFGIQLISTSIFAKQYMPFVIFLIYLAVLAAGFLVANKWMRIRRLMPRILSGMLLGLISSTAAIDLMLVYIHGYRHAVEIMVHPLDFLPLVTMGWLGGGVLASFMREPASLATMVLEK